MQRVETVLTSWEDLMDKYSCPKCKADFKKTKNVFWWAKKISYSECMKCGHVWNKQPLGGHHV